VRASRRRGICFSVIFFFLFFRVIVVIIVVHFGTPLTLQQNCANPSGWKCLVARTRTGISDSICEWHPICFKTILIGIVVPIRGLEPTELASPR
jgi:hypothetical protein